MTGTVSPAGGSRPTADGQRGGSARRRGRTGGGPPGRRGGGRRRGSMRCALSVLVDPATKISAPLRCSSSRGRPERSRTSPEKASAQRRAKNGGRARTPERGLAVRDHRRRDARGIRPMDPKSISVAVALMMRDHATCVRETDGARVTARRARSLPARKPYPQPELTAVLVLRRRPEPSHVGAAERETPQRQKPAAMVCEHVPCAGCAAKCRVPCAYRPPALLHANDRATQARVPLAHTQSLTCGGCGVRRPTPAPARVAGSGNVVQTSRKTAAPPSWYTRLQYWPPVIAPAIAAMRRRLLLAAEPGRATRAPCRCVIQPPGPAAQRRRSSYGPSSHARLLASYHHRRVVAAPHGRAARSRRTAASHVAREGLPARRSAASSAEVLALVQVAALRVPRRIYGSSVAPRAAASLKHSPITAR